jgi:hypothetical protein
VKHVKRRWDLDNQFGTLVVQTKKVTSLWVPVATSASGAPAAPSDATHYKCYQITALGVASDQTPETAPGSGQFKFRKDVQAFFLDQFGDCTLNQDGTPSFMGSPVQGRCLYNVKKLVELCNPVTKSAVDPPRETAAVIDGSTPAGTDSLVCYQAALATKFLNTAAAGLVGATVGTSVDPKQSKHVKRKLSEGTQLFTTPGNQFPAPAQVDTSKTEMVCIPTTVTSVTGLP